MANENFQIQYVAESLDLSTLAGFDTFLDQTDIDAARLQGMRIMRGEYCVSWHGQTANEGPLVVGVSIGDYAAADIEEALEANPQSRGKPVEQAVANRALWLLGIIPRAGAANDLQGHLNNGLPIVVQHKWSIPQGLAGMQYWVYNLDTGTLTGGMSVNVFGKVTGIWLED